MWREPFSASQANAPLAEWRRRIGWPLLRVCWLAWLVVLISPLMTWAQPSNEKKSATDTKRVESPASSGSNAPSELPTEPLITGKRGGVRPGPDDVVPLLGPDGKVMLIPRLENWEEFQSWVKNKAVVGGPASPDFSVSSISFEGTLESPDDTVTLMATISIVVNKADGDVLVPLQLNEATLLKLEHRGPGDRQFEDFDRELGYRWWLSGKGQHDLVLTMAVPVRRQAAMRRLLLSLPVTPVSGVKLIVPLPKVSAKGSERSVVRVKSLDQGRSEIQAFGLGNLLDLSWQALTDNTISKPELQASSYISADLRGETLVLEATQLVRSIQGTFDKLTVRLPPEFELIESVSGRDVKGSTVIAGTPSRVSIDLATPTQGPIELKWVLSTKLAPMAVSLPPIEGFEVEDARRQAGFVKVSSWEGINLRKRDGEDRFLHQTSESELRDISGFSSATSNHGNTSVYRFLKQPFRLILDVQKVEPYFACDPVHVVKFSPTRIDWEMTIPTQVFRGSLSELTLPWPRFKSEGWEQLTSETPELVESITIDETPSGSVLRLRLVDRRSRSDGAFDLRVKARRAYPVDGTAFELSFPSVADSGRKASKIVMAPSTNLELQSLPKDDSLIRPTTPEEDVLDVLESTRNVSAWRCDAGNPEFTMTGRVQQQSVQTQSVSELAFDARAISVTQRMTYDVSFEPLTQLRLMIPKSISERVRFSMRDGTGAAKPLTPFYTGLEIDQQRQCRIPLENPRLGRFDIVAEFDIDRATEISDDETTMLNLPVLQSSDAEFATTRVQWKSGERFTAALNDPAWQPELVADKTSLWKVSGAKTAIALKLTALAETTVQDFTVHRAIIRTVLSEGRAHSQSLFELDSDVREITLLLPTEITSRDVHVWWNRQTVEPVRRTLPTGETQLRIRPPASRGRADSPEQNGDHSSNTLLWVEYSAQTPTRFGWSNSHQLFVPQFASTVWMAQTIWEVVLPPDQHLLTVPRDFAAQFQWQRGTLFWSRQPNTSYSRIEQVLSDAAPKSSGSIGWDALQTDVGAGNVYPLSCFGAPHPLQFETMSRPAVVGCGAGLALVLAFLLIRMPSTRHVLTFLALGFGMALAALWFAEPVKVLLQPAILGAVMALVAAMIDRVGRRERAEPLVTLSSPSDFYAAGSSIVPGSRASIDREAPTIAPQEVPHESATASNHGGRQ